MVSPSRRLSVIVVRRQSRHCVVCWATGGTPGQRLVSSLDSRSLSPRSTSPGTDTAHPATSHVMRPSDADPAAFMRRQPEGSQVVHDIVAAYDGSISAEHGLGRLKTDEARRYKSATEIAAMQAIRDALDPNRIMNPAVLF